MVRTADVRYFETAAQIKRGLPMRVSDALVLSSILGGVACATQVPIDESVLLATWDGGFYDDGFGGVGNGNAGFSSEFGGFPTSTGGTPFVTGGTGPFASNGGQPAAPTQSTGGRMATPPPPPPPMTTGGRSGAGAGGAPSSAGAPSGSAGAQCRDGEKVCGGVCVSPGPKTGCGLTGCDPCSISAPTNGVVICTSSRQCDVSCLSGFTKNGNTCEAPPPPPPTTGGGSQCGGQSCPTCTVILGPGCCTSAGKCGCPLIPWTGGILGCI